MNGLKLRHSTSLTLATVLTPPVRYLSLPEVACNLPQDLGPGDEDGYAGGSDNDIEYQHEQQRTDGGDPSNQFGAYPAQERNSQAECQRTDICKNGKSDSD